MIRQGLDYEVVKGWGRLPKGWVYTQVAGVAVDSKDRVLILCRGKKSLTIRGLLRIMPDLRPSGTNNMQRPIWLLSLDSDTFPAAPMTTPTASTPERQAGAGSVVGHEGVGTPRGRPGSAARLTAGALPPPSPQAGRPAPQVGARGSACQPRSFRRSR